MAQLPCDNRQSNKSVEAESVKMKVERLVPKALTHENPAAESEHVVTLDDTASPARSVVEEIDPAPAPAAVVRCLILVRGVVRVSETGFNLPSISPDPIDRVRQIRRIRHDLPLVYPDKLVVSTFALPRSVVV